MIKKVQRLRELCEVAESALAMPAPGRMFDRFHVAFAWRWHAMPVIALPRTLGFRLDVWSAS